MKRTINNIIYNKFLDNLETATFKDLFNVIIILIFTALISFIMIYPVEILDFIKNILKMNNFALIKIFSSYMFVRNFWNLRNTIIKIINDITLKDKDTIEWVPTIELIDYLFEHKTFKRSDIEEIFWMPRNRFDVMAKRLDELWILIRWENNSRILNEDMTRQQIVKILMWSEFAKNINPKSFKISENTFTFEPAKKFLKEKINILMSPSHDKTFKIEKL